MPFCGAARKVLTPNSYKTYKIPATPCCSFVSMNYNLVIGHGNGPQVGNVLLQQDAGRKVYELQVMPMDFCVAETQGSIGYMIERTLRNELAVRKLRRNVVTMVTEVVVDRNDERFANPTKPIGPYYTKEQADRMAEADGSIFREDPKGNGWRKVVASPYRSR